MSESELEKKDICSLYLIRNLCATSLGSHNHIYLKICANYEIQIFFLECKTLLIKLKKQVFISKTGILLAESNSGTLFFLDKKRTI
jgi:hypothetical protein